jgi:hypothetical protein
LLYVDSGQVLIYAVTVYLGTGFARRKVFAPEASAFF